MATLTTLDRDLLAQLAAEPLLLSTNSQHPDLEQLEKLVGYGWVTTTHCRQGGTIYRLTSRGQNVLEGQGA